MTSRQVTIFITTIANIIAEGKSESEIRILASMLSQLASTLSTISIFTAVESIKEEGIKEESIKEESIKEESIKE